MKIIDIQAIPIRIPLKNAFTIAVGTLTHTNHVLVRMTDDEGHVGWGETTTFHVVYGYDQHMLAHVLREYLIPAVMGLDPHDLALMHKRMDEAIPKNLMAKTGVDLAAHDLIAQAAGVPLVDMIGGRRMDRIPQIGLVGISPPEEAALSAMEQINEGYRTIKIKVGGNAGEDLRRIEAVREAVGGGIGIRVDGNCGYDRDTALRTFVRAEEYGLEWIEQPLPAWDLEGMAALARRLDTPIAVDESMYTLQDAQHCIALGAADVVNIKIPKCGGIFRSRKIAAACEAAGVPCFLGGCIETTPGTAAAMHFYAATPNMVSATEIFGSMYYEDDVTAAPLTVENGSIALTHEPGLGVRVDVGKVEKYRADV